MFKKIIYLSLLLLIAWISLMQEEVINRFVISVVCIGVSLAMFNHLQLNIPKFSLSLVKISYLFYLFKEIFLSAARVAKLAWSSEIHLNPVKLWIDSGQSNEIAKTVYGNSITLTPGTITIEVDENNFLVHALDSTFMEDLKTGEMQAKVRSSFS